MRSKIKNPLVDDETGLPPTCTCCYLVHSPCSQLLTTGLLPERIIKTIKRAKDEDRRRKKEYKAEFRRKCWLGSSEGAKMRARKEAVRNGHRFRRYGSLIGR